MRSSLLIAIMSFLTACASRPLNPDGVKPGMDKDQVLELAGNPKRTYRTSGQDNWVYVYYQGNEETQRHVAFEDGRVVAITRPAAKQALTRELEAAGKIESFENKAQAKPHNEGFKAIDGGPDDVDKP